MNDSNDDIIRSRTFEIGKTILGYEIVKRIGKGGFGSIWVIRDPKTQKIYALKAEKRKHHVNTLLIEKSCLSALQDSPYFPILYLETTIPRYNILIMECLGPSLRKLRHKMHGNRFSLSTCLRVGIEMLRALKAFHDHGFIHRDIKPDNFCLRPSRSAPLALIDYGLTRRYLSPDGQKLPIRPYVGFTGTAKFANFATHDHQEQLRRDDCQSWFYSFLQLLLGRLPWSGIEGRENVYKIKKETDYESLLSLRPHQIVEIHDILFSLPHEAEPPYEEIIGLLEEAFEENNFSWNDPYDWDHIKPRRMSHLSVINLTPPINDKPVVPLSAPYLRTRSMSIECFRDNNNNNNDSSLRVSTPPSKFDYQNDFVFDPRKSDEITPLVLQPRRRRRTFIPRSAPQFSNDTNDTEEEEEKDSEEARINLSEL